MRSALVAALAALALTACTGDKGDKGDKGDPGAAGAAGASGQNGAAGQDGSDGQDAYAAASVSAVTPTRAFLGRTLDVTVSGDATTWSATTTVDFGAGITVNHLTVASVTALVANISVAGDATVGARDVVVHDGTSSQTFAGAFTVDSPLGLTVQGTVAQGSILAVHARTQDLTTPFDTTTEGDGLFTPITYPNLAIDLAATSGITASVSGASDFAVDFTALVDVTAPAAAQDLTIESGPQGATTEFAAPAAINVVARQPIALVAGTPINGTVDQPYESGLYTYVPADGTNLVEFSADTTSIALLPASGRWSDLISYAATASVLTTSSDPFYLVTWDSSGGTSAYTLSATNTALAGSADEVSTTNDSMADSQLIPALPFALTHATLSSSSDQDWLHFVADASMVGQSVHVQTLPGDAYTDTVVDVLDATGTSLGGPSDDLDYHEDFVSSPIPAEGDYFVRIYASDYFDPSQSHYTAVVRLQ
jgi:hypothetical protein